MEKSKSKNICNNPECNTRANFNFKEFKKPMYCSKHKENGMINVESKRCNFEGCNKVPAFNFEGTKTGLWCASHKENGMINIFTLLCRFEGCKTQPSFNVEGEKKGIFCFQHKENGMINVEGKRCGFEGCNFHPMFNFEGEKQGLYCSKHKKEGMINIKTDICMFNGCKTQPKFNFKEFKKPIYCSKHKENGMINVESKQCDFENCKIQPNFNFKEEKQGLYCCKHKKDGMINVISKTCKSEWCNTLVKNKYDGYCLHCFIHLFPEKTVVRNYKTKERSVAEFVLREFPQYPWTNDKQIQDGCSRRRPDLFMDFGYQILIIEIDENQHTGENYGDCSCENKRMMLLSQDVGHRPIVFIRFNPDDYYEKEQHITSCFGINSLGICCVKKTKQREWTQRLNVLRENIQYWCEHRTEKTIEIIQLFYDV